MKNSAIMFVHRELTDKLHELKRSMERAVVNRVVEDFIDVAAPLRHFTDAVNAPEGLSINHSSIA